MFIKIRMNINFIDHNHELMLKMLKLLIFCIDTCINSLQKTVFYSFEAFGVDPVTLKNYRLFQIIKRAFKIVGIAVTFLSYRAVCHPMSSEHKKQYRP